MYKDKILKQEQDIVNGNGKTSHLYSSSAKSIARRKIKELENMETEFVITNEEEVRSFVEQFSESKLFRQCFVKLEIPTPNKLGQKIIGINEYNFKEYANDDEQRGYGGNRISFYFENGSELPYNKSFQISGYSNSDLQVKIRKNGNDSTVDECVEYFKQHLFGTAVTNKIVYVNSEFTIDYQNKELKYLIPLNEKRIEPNEDIEKFIKEHVSDMGVYSPYTSRGEIPNYTKTKFTFCHAEYIDKQKNKKEK